MRRPVALCALLVAIASGVGTSHADELDEWCAQAKKASSVVICSDAELRAQAIARNKLFEAARVSLSPEAYKALSDDQSRWVKSYTARCGVALDGPVPSLPVPEGVISCYRRESRVRTAELTRRLSGAASADLDRSAKEIANEALVSIGIPRPQVEAMAAWEDCTEAAVDRFADQPEQARTVAEAAMAVCIREESKYLIAKGFTDPSASGALREAAMPDLLARVMAIRAARAKPQSSSPSAPSATPREGGQKMTPAPWSSETSDEDLRKWIHCTLAAVDALADQPEPAQTVANAVFGSCLNEEIAYQKSAGLSDRELEANKTAIMFPRVLAQVMAVRAAHAKLRQGSPKAGPAIDYNRM